MINSKFFNTLQEGHKRWVTRCALVLVTISYLCAVARCQTAVVLAPIPQLQFFDQSGNPLAFGCVFTYEVASTTPLATYTDYTGVTQNQNPVILTAGGSANIWIQAGQAYTFRVKSAGGSQCSTGSTLYTVDGIGGGSQTLTTIVPYSPTPAFPVTSQNQLFLITLTGNASAAPLTFVGVTPPSVIFFQITQDSAGGHTFSWPANSVGGCTIGSAANQVTTQEFVYNGTNATAVGPCVIGNGPELSTGEILANGDVNVTGDVNVSGAVIAPIFQAASVDAANSGILRLEALDSTCWRNEGNTSDLCLGKDISNNLESAAPLVIGNLGVVAGGTYVSGASACTPGTQAVTFTNGGGSGVTGTITVTGTVPVGAVTITYSGSGYGTPPTTGTIATCTGTATFTGARLGIPSTSITTGPSYSSGASACTNGTQVVTFTNGGGSSAQGTITVSGNVPTGAVTMTNQGSGYATVPTTGTVASCTGTAAFTGGALGPSATGALPTGTHTGTGDVALDNSPFFESPALNGVVVTGQPLGAGQSIVSTSTTAAHFGTPPAILSSTISTLGSPISVSQSTTTTILNPTITMPAYGCPCRAFVSWGINFESSDTGVASAWVNDATNSFASGWYGVASSYNSGTGFNASSYSTGTYANGASVTFTLSISQSTSGAFNVQSTAEFTAGQVTWMNIAIVASN
jgi:hypothetical protein